MNEVMIKAMLKAFGVNADDLKAQAGEVFAMFQEFHATLLRMDRKVRVIRETQYEILNAVRGGVDLPDAAMSEFAKTLSEEKANAG